MTSNWLEQNNLHLTRTITNNDIPFISRWHKSFAAKLHLKVIKKNGAS